MRERVPSRKRAVRTFSASRPPFFYRLRLAANTDPSRRQLLFASVSVTPHLPPAGKIIAQSFLHRAARRRRPSGAKKRPPLHSACAAPKPSLPCSVPLRLVFRSLLWRLAPLPFGSADHHFRFRRVRSRVGLCAAFRLRGACFAGGVCFGGSVPFRPPGSRFVALCRRVGRVRGASARLRSLRLRPFVRASQGVACRSLFGSLSFPAFRRRFRSVGVFAGRSAVCGACARRRAFVFAGVSVGALRPSGSLAGLALCAFFPPGRASPVAFRPASPGLALPFSGLFCCFPVFFCSFSLLSGLFHGIITLFGWVGAAVAPCPSVFSLSRFPGVSGGVLMSSVSVSSSAVPSVASVPSVSPSLPGLSPALVARRSRLAVLRSRRRLWSARRRGCLSPSSAAALLLGGGVSRFAFSSAAVCAAGRRAVRRAAFSALFPRPLAGPRALARLGRSAPCPRCGGVWGLGACPCSVSLPALRASLARSARRRASQAAGRALRARLRAGALARLRARRSVGARSWAAVGRPVASGAFGRAFFRLFSARAWSLWPAPPVSRFVLSSVSLSSSGRRAVRRATFFSLFPRPVFRPAFSCLPRGVRRRRARAAGGFRW